MKTAGAQACSVAGVIVLEIPTAPPSRNQLDKMHWAKRARFAADLRRAVSMAFSLTGEPQRAVPHGSHGELLLVSKRPAVGHRFVRIVRRGPRKLDADNLSGALKSLVDALKFVGLIEDDRPGLVTVAYDQERGAGCRVEVWSPSEIAGGV